METCHYGVTRKGEFEPCDKPAVGLRICEGEFADYPPYPVCQRHFNKRKQPEPAPAPLDLTDEEAEAFIAGMQAQGRMLPPTITRSVVFPWTRPPLSMNDRLHHMREAKLKAEVRRAAALAFADFPPSERVEVTLTWTVKDRQRRDDENPVATLKPLCDGLVDAGVVPDDTHQFMVKNMPIIRYVKGATPEVRLDVRVIEKETREREA